MNRTLQIAIFFAVFLVTLSLPASVWADFDETAWEYYAEIRLDRSQGEGFAALRLDPLTFSELEGTPPFADLRVLTDAKIEVPYQLVVREPTSRQAECRATVFNRSHTATGEAWCEARLESPETACNTVEILTGETDFLRPVEIFGSSDGRAWNLIREDGVIFDHPQERKLQRLRVSFAPSAFPFLAVRVGNGGRPFALDGIRLFREETSPGEPVSVPARLQEVQEDPKAQASLVTVALDRRYPVRRLKLQTGDSNFQRVVEIEVRRVGRWERIGDDIIYNVTTGKGGEEKLEVAFPEVSAEEMRLLIRNGDSPSLRISGVRAEGYARELVFKQSAARAYYLFWGNPRARSPRYDLSPLLARPQGTVDAVATLGPAKPNPDFAGARSRLPWTERWKAPLYGLLALIIIGLVALQYRVFRQTGPP